MRFATELIHTLLTEPGDDQGHTKSSGQLLFAQFDLGKVLNYGASLVGSEDKQYDVDHGTNRE